MALPLRQRIQIWWYRRKMMKLAKYCRIVDQLLVGNNIPRSERKQFWRTFYKRADVLEGVLDQVDWSK